MDALRRRAGNQLNSFLKRYGFELIPTGVIYDWQRSSSPLSPPPEQWSALPSGAPEYLRESHPRLIELQKRYKACDDAVTTPMLWKDGFVRPEDIQNFRADNAYVWQRRGPNMNETAYVLTDYYVRSVDEWQMLTKLDEDELFGAFTMPSGDKLISRDLLDSILEIYFLDRHLQLTSRQSLTVLDIGAGYGRLAHRMTTALPAVRNYYCTDAIPVSTFICEYYLRYRGVDDRARALPLDEVEETVGEHHPDIALNIHSFSECTLAAIDWWLSLLKRHGVKHLMVVPNTGNHGGAQLLTNDGKDFGAVIREHGYRLMVREPKFADPVVQKYAINPTYYYLFELDGTK